MYDIIIVGGGPAGMTAAVYARRQGKTALVIEKGAFGGQTVFSPKIENIPGFPAISGLDFADKLVDQVISQGGEFANEEVVEIVSNDNGTKTVITDCGRYDCKAVVLATGAKHRLLGVPDEEDFIGNGISFCAVCDGAFYRDRDVILIGGGNSALVEANLLVKTVRSLTIVQNLAFLTGEKALVDAVLSHPNVHVIYNTVVSSIISDNGDFKGIKTLNTESKTEDVLYGDGMFVAIGLIPDTDFLKNVVTLDKLGYIKANETCRTNIDGVFTAGDCRTKEIRQVATACADGAVAALAACKYIGN